MRDEFATSRSQPPVLERDGDRLRVSGPLTMRTVSAAVAQGASALRDGVRRLDLSGVTEIDSAAVALLLDWTRGEPHASFVIEAAPAVLRDLAKLYAVEKFLPFAPA